MQSFMMYGERGASRAARDRIYLHLGEDYGWLYRVMQRSGTFLLASCSKLCMTPTVTAVYPLLGFFNPMDARSDTVSCWIIRAATIDDAAGGSGFDSQL
jgi:hypothetical protein